MAITGTQSLTTSRARGPGGPDASRAPSGCPAAFPAVSVRGLTKSYHAGAAGCTARVEALRGIDLDVRAGEALGLLGPAGAGKSTLLLCLAGLLRPDAGSIAWFGRAADDAGRPPGIAYVPERAAHYAFMTVREAVDYNAILQGVAAECRSAALDEALEHAGLASAGSTRIGDLPWSAGPRLCLAQALVGRPRMLLLDETLSGLDHQSRREIAGTLRGLVEGGVTIVIAAETLDALDGLATRVAVTIDGRITSPVEVAALQRPRLLELSVATPAVARRIFGTRVAEEPWDRHILRLPLDGTTAEAILARCRASGIRVESSRVVAAEIDATRTEAADVLTPDVGRTRC